MKIGICGGTFDPFHRGHLDPILAVRDSMEWDRVVYVPAFVQPFKREQQTASSYHRFARTVLGTEGDEALSVSPQELERGEVSYTVDTLQSMRRGFTRDDTLDWVIGDDNVAKLMEWKSIDTIFELANFVVLTRVSSQIPQPLRSRISNAFDRPPCGAIVFAENATVPVSSTEIRRRVRTGESIDGLVGKRVANYIDHYGLYRKDDQA